MTAYERQLWYWQNECDSLRKEMNACEDIDPQKEALRTKYGIALKCLKEVMKRGTA